MIYDRDRDKIVMFGGVNDFVCDGCDVTWVWDGAAWEPLSPAVKPPGRTTEGFAYDEARGEAVLFGSPSQAGSPLNDTWVWDGEAWIEKHPPLSPPGRGAPIYGNMLVYDRARDVVLLFGGHTSQGRANPPLNDTWTWDGETWTQMFPVTSPPAYGQGFMAYDASRQVVVLLIAGRTWIWDSANWIEQQTTSAPPISLDGEIGYDENRQQAVFVGMDSLDVAPQTWIWNGEDWQQAEPDAGLHAGLYHFRMVYDSRYQTLLLFAFGGGKMAGTETFELFTWAGERWQEVR